MEKNEENQETKICQCCKRELPLDSFRRQKLSEDGYSNTCQECINTKRRINASNKSGGNSTPTFGISAIIAREHEELKNVPPRAMMEHLAWLGYDGVFTFLHKFKLINDPT